jgi:Domain of unknown function (DUF4160)
LTAGKSGAEVVRGEDNMPTVLRWRPYRAFFYLNEGDEPAHVHVRAGNKEVKVWLHDLTVAVNMGFPAHELSDIIRHLRSNRTQLMTAWNDYFGN